MTQLTTRQLYSIIKLQQDMARLGMNLSSIMSFIVLRLQDLLPVDGVVIELKEQDLMVYRACAGLASPYLGMALPAGDSLSGICMQTGEVQHCPDVEKDLRVNIEACRKIGIQSMLIVPLHYFDLPVGVIKVMTRKRGRFASRNIAFLQLVAEQLGSVMYFCTRYGSDNLLYQATHDSLTQLVNRSVLMETLRGYLRQPDLTVLVIMLDMNDLKTINDNYGHRFGDAALIEISRRLCGCTRPGDIVARLGGDEFAILMPFAATPDVAAIIERIRSQTHRNFVFENFQRELSIAIGHALYPAEAADIDQLLHTADLRMYHDKQTVKRQPASEFSI